MNDMAGPYGITPASFMDSSYVAQAVLASLRRGQLPSNDEAAALDRRPLIDRLRELIGSDDRGWLTDLIRRRSDPVAGLAASVLRHAMDEGLFQFYVRQWNVSSPYLKNRIMWRMLDWEQLPSQWHCHFFEFIRQNWNVFRDFNLAYYGGSDGALNSVVDRIGDPSFPISKKWVYACSVPEVVPYGRAARSLLSLARQVGDDFAVKVVEYLERRFLSGDDDEATGWTVPSLPANRGATEFVAASVLDRMRDGDRPDETGGDCLNRVPVVDALRRRIREDDLSWIMDVLDEESGEVGGLYLSLLQKHDLRDDVRDYLRAAWEEASPFMRAHMMWRILDDPELPPAWHDRIHDFVFAEWKVFHEVSLRFLGDPQAVINEALKRMVSQDYPATKRWAYLCRIVDVGADHQAVRALLQLAEQIDDNNMSGKVAGELLRRFYS